MTEKESQFLRNKKPSKPNKDQSSDRETGMNFMDYFRAGLNNPDMSFETWSDLQLSPKEWLSKYPDKTIEDWKWWKEKQDKKSSWLDKIFRFKLW